MGLETTTYINGLVASNPAGGDDRSQGDDHIRLIKSAIKNTFPNIDGAMTLTDEVINALPTTKANLESPTFTGVPAAPTAAPGTNTTQLATTAFVTLADNLKANIASPTLTGTPAAPTAAPGTNTTQLATTAFVKAAIAVGEGSSASGNGWVKLPGGLIFQWGSRSCSFVPGNTASPVTFPIAFTTVFQTYATFDSSSVQTTSAVIGTASKTTTGFNIHTYSNNSFAASVAWFAIGV